MFGYLPRSTICASLPDTAAQRAIPKPSATALMLHRQTMNVLLGLRAGMVSGVFADPNPIILNRLPNVSGFLEQLLFPPGAARPSERRYQALTMSWYCYRGL